jgi:spermidine/putrescine transport system ATP-binding protein
VLRGVAKTFGGLTAITDIDIEVAPGEFVVLLGPSGCGKTTTLRVIAGFTAPTTGTVTIDGTDVTSLRPRRRNIGMVFQNYALFPTMTVAENVAFGLRQRRRPSAAIRARVDELLALVRLEDKRDGAIQALSGGQQQRVALARALACSPRVLLMDEPLGALDLKLREAMQVELRRIQRAFGITTVLVTHDQQEAMNLADRIVVMDHGRVQQAATPEQIYRRPANRFVAGFVGKNNFVRGRVARFAGGVALIDFGGTLVPVCAAGLRPGDAAELAIRPEHVRVASAVESGVASVASGRIAGHIASRSFAGSLTHYAVAIESGDTLLVEQPSGPAVLAPGDPVLLDWDPDQAMLLERA